MHLSDWVHWTRYINCNTNCLDEKYQLYELGYHIVLAYVIKWRQKEFEKNVIISKATSYYWGGWNVIRYHILDPLKIKYPTPLPQIKYQISDPPQNKSNHVFANKSDIWLKKSDIRPPKIINYQISHPINLVRQI